MWRRSGRYVGTALIAILLAALLLFMLAPGLAEKPTRSGMNTSDSPPGLMSGKLDQQPSPLIQCNIGLILPLLLVGLVTLDSRSKRNKK
jgi:hypothetical protein